MNSTIRGILTGSRIVAKLDKSASSGSEIREHGVGPKIVGSGVIVVIIRVGDRLPYRTYRAKATVSAGSADTT